MKTAIIGAGNMGESIARGLAKGTIIPANDIIVSNPTQHKLDVLKAEFPAYRLPAIIKKPLRVLNSLYLPSSHG